MGQYREFNNNVFRFYLCSLLINSIISKTVIIDQKNNKMIDDIQGIFVKKI